MRARRAQQDASTDERDATRKQQARQRRAYSFERWSFVSLSVPSVLTVALRRVTLYCSCCTLFVTTPSSRSCSASPAVFWYVDGVLTRADDDDDDDDMPGGPRPVELG